MKQIPSLVEARCSFVVMLSGCNGQWFLWATGRQCGHTGDRGPLEKVRRRRTQYDTLGADTSRAVPLRVQGDALNVATHAGRSLPANLPTQVSVGTGQAVVMSWTKDWVLMRVEEFGVEAHSDARTHSSSGSRKLTQIPTITHHEKRRRQLHERITSICLMIFVSPQGHCCHSGMK